MFRELFYRYVLEMRNDARRIYRFFNKKKKNQKHKNKNKRNRTFLDKINNNNTYLTLAIIMRLLFNILSKTLYVFIFMLIPSLIFGSLCSPEGFQLRQSIVYFTVIMTCFCGSLVRPGMFDMDEEAYVMLTTMQMNSANFFRGRLVTKLCDDFAGFLIAFLLVGMDFGHAFYLVVWIIMARIIGEAANVYVFRCKGRVISEMPGATVAIMAFAFFFSYGFSFIRGYVVDFTKYVYDFVWLFAGLTVSALVLYGIILYEDYSFVAKRFVRKMNEKIGENLQDQQDEIDLLAGDGNLDKHFKEYDKDEATGVDYIHKIFFTRNTEYIYSSIFIRAVIMVVATIVTIVICKLSPQTFSNMVWTVIGESLPIMVFVMYCLSVTPGVCKSLFYHIDMNTLSGAAKTSSIFNFKNFIVRLRKVCLFDMAIAVFLCVSFGLVGTACGHQDELSELIPVYCGIIMLAVFFSIFNLTVYYMFQPYNKDLKLKNHKYFMAHFAMLLIAYACVYISFSSIVFDIIIGIVLAVSLSLSSYFVYNFSDRTFKISKR